MTSNTHPPLSHDSTETFAPIDQLPTELLRKIFKECTLPDPSQTFDRLTTAIPLPEPNIAEAPLLLTRVSSRWRSVATSFPELWSSIRVDDSNLPHSSTVASFCAMLERWLRNSQNMPLNVVLYEGRSDTNTIWQKIIPVFRNHAHHCAMLVASSPLSEKMFDQHVEMPMLQRFGGQVPVCDLAGMPDLTGLTELCSKQFVNYSQLPHHAAQKLRKLDLLECEEPSDIFGMLLHFPKLQTFRMRYLNQKEPVYRREITHDCIEELAVPLAATLFGSKVVPRMRFPKLRSLSMWGPWYKSHLKGLESWLNASGLYLEQLCLEGWLDEGMTDEEVAEMFKPYARKREVKFEE